MVEVAIMVEGQHGVNWDNWTHVAEAVEDAGFAGLYRSDHFTDPEGPYRDSLALWPSLTWLADNTTRIEFGSLVTPMSFRHPVHTARRAKDVDALSGGRFTLGLGAGWQEREHETFGFDLREVGPRFDRFEEGVEVVHRLLRERDPVDFAGEYFALDGAELHPRPAEPGRPPILVGGGGPHRTLPLAARFADEWNCIFKPPDEFAELNGHFEGLLADTGRDSGDVRRSMMTRVLFARDGGELDELVAERDPDDLRERGAIVGTADAVRDQLAALEEAGLDRVMCQWLDLEDVERLRAFGDAVL